MANNRENQLKLFTNNMNSIELQDIYFVILMLELFRYSLTGNLRIYFP